MEYIIRHEYRDIHNALLRIFSEILQDKMEYTIYSSKTEKRRKDIVGMGMRMVTEKELSITFYIKDKREGSVFNFTINCELTIKKQGLGEFAIYSKNEEEAYVIINIFEFLTERFYRAQLDRELLGE